MLFARLRCQGITDARFRNVESVIGWMGAVQAQDYGQAKWAVGMRCAAREAEVDAAVNEGRILRTHVLRPTWHFVLPADIGWMLRLTAPRVKAFCQPYHRKLGIDAAVLKRSKTIMIKAMEGGQQLTRVELAAQLRAAKMDTSDIRMNFLLMDAELDGLICSGARKGASFTYALLEGRVGRQNEYPGEAALAELTRRYFQSRGPATAADLAWWGGMTLGQARRGLDMVGKDLERVLVGGEEYWWGGEEAGKMREVVLLAGFDEYMVGYKDRSAMLPPEFAKQTAHGLRPVVLVRGRVAGMWKRNVVKGEVTVEVSPLGDWSARQSQLVKKEAARFESWSGIVSR